jgi:signal peptidase II
VPGKTGKKKISRPLFSFLTITSVFLLDRLSKIFILSHYQEGGGFPVWQNVFHITRVNNTGAAFGFLRGHTPFLSLVSVFCVLILLWILFFKKQTLSNRAGWSLVVGGALGNLYDRFFYGYVVDFLDFRVWPVFNLADTAICVGVLVVAFKCIRSFFK